MDRMRRVVMRTPDDEEAQSFLAELAVLTRASDAGTLLEPIARAGPDERAQILPETMRTLYAWTLARRGDRAKADSLWNVALTAARQHAARSNDDFAPFMEIAAISAVRGDTAAALEALGRGYQAGFKDYRSLGRDPFFDGIRAHPRFRQIAARMQADVSAMRARAAAANDTIFEPVHRRR
jgi:hypothetical protein